MEAALVAFMRLPSAPAPSSLFCSPDSKPGKSTGAPKIYTRTGDQ
ncbi:hypothetical protein E2320_012401, partial [Naja naja]